MNCLVGAGRVDCIIIMAAVTGDHCIAFAVSYCIDNRLYPTGMAGIAIIRPLIDVLDYDITQMTILAGWFVGLRHIMVRFPGVTGFTVWIRTGNALTITNHLIYKSSVEFCAGIKMAGVTFSMQGIQ